MMDPNGADVMKVQDVVSLLVGLSAVLTSLWGYFFTVTLGLATVVGGLSLSRFKASRSVLWVLSGLILIFFALNGYAIYTHQNEVNQLISYLTKPQNGASPATGSSELTATVGGLTLTMKPLIAHPVAIGALLFLIWELRDGTRAAKPAVPEVATFTPR